MSTLETLDLTASSSRVHRHLRCTRGARRPLAAASAWMLILLVALPFTAPFSTCNLSELMSTAHVFTMAWTAAGQPSASIEGAATQSSPGSVLEEEQFKDGALSDAPVVSQVSSRADAAPRLQPHDTTARSAVIALRL